MIPAEKIIVALDTQDPVKCTELLHSLSSTKVWVKIGMELFYAEGPRVIHEAKALGLNVFLDLKLHDIPQTVASALKALSRLPIDMINVHAAGGLEMMQRSYEVFAGMNKRPLLIAVTQLTSTSEEQMQREQRISGSIQDSVLHYAHLSHQSHFDGVVCSPHEIKLIKENIGSKFLTVTPGIRPPGVESHDQKRITTPREALALGTDFMVMGRPITGAVNPREALETILQGN
jgi:orotidine-5'-phosphate decarboxylase